MKKFFLFSLMLYVGMSDLQAGLKDDRESRLMVEISRDGEISLGLAGISEKVIFFPEFSTAYFEKAPRISLERIERRGTVDNINYRTLAWNKEMNFFSACRPVPEKIEKVETVGDTLKISFLPSAYGRLVVLCHFDEKWPSEVVEIRYSALKDGYHSVGYCGAPEIQPADAVEVWQPLIWTQNRFPGDSYMTPDFLCPLPVSMVSTEDMTYGLVVDPDSFGFEKMPTRKRFLFGMLLRNEAGLAQPMVWANVPGTGDSEMKAGEDMRFRFRIFLSSDSILEVQEDMAMNLYSLDNYSRDNSLGISMNGTLDNMIEYGMSQFSWFVDELKGCSYETDVKNAVKNTSSLNPLNIALVTDNAGIYEKRFLPMCEYMLSRESLLFSLDEKPGTGQKPSSMLGKPVMNCTEALALYEASGNESTFLLNDIADEKLYRFSSRKENERYWKDRLAYYNATGDASYLQEAEEGADKYVREVVSDIQDSFDYRGNSTSSFWTQLSPKFPELYNMYRATGNKSYLEAARYGARRYAQFIWMSPAIPDSLITVNKGGYAPKQKPWGEKMRVPEEKVDCWRVSEIGLHCECAATSSSHRGVFMTHYAPYMLKIATETGDLLLSRIANWAMVGRYANFPGYHMNTDRTTAYEKKNFPLRTHTEMNVNSMHYNHIWPMISIVLDYIVTDVISKSDGRIEFSSIPVEAFANLGSELYGFDTGSFYGEKVRLWMPSRIVVSDNPQINYITCRNIGSVSGNDDILYIALSNQSDDWQTAEISLDEELVSGMEHSELVRLDKGDGTCMKKGNRLTVSIPPAGYMAMSLDKVSLAEGFQQLYFSGKPDVWKKDFCKDEYGRAMILNFGGLPDRFYSYISGDASRYDRVGMSYRIDGGNWTDILDCSFPFEFSFELPDDAEIIEYKYVAVDMEGNPTYTETKSMYK